MAFSAGTLKLEHLITCYINVPAETNIVQINGKGVPVLDLVKTIRDIISQLPEIII